MKHVVGNSIALSYIAGVLHGDGWCGKNTIGLKVKDFEFAQAFAISLSLAGECFAKPHKDGGRYWRSMARNDSGRFDHIRSFVPESIADKGAWVRGMFDSEGNADLRHKPSVSQNAYGRRVAFYSTAMATLTRTQGYLNDMGIASYIRPQKASATHHGTKQVYELSLVQSRENFLLFAMLVGSSIDRKRSALLALPLSYQPDKAATCRAAQKVGAIAKHKKLMEVTLPMVIRELKNLIDSGVKPTTRACGSIQRFTSVQRYFSQAELVEMAKQ